MESLEELVERAVVRAGAGSIMVRRQRVFDWEVRSYHSDTKVSFVGWGDTIREALRDFLNAAPSA